LPNRELVLIIATLTEDPVNVELTIRFRVVTVLTVLATSVEKSSVPVVILYAKIDEFTVR